jgi:hypothetical protein
MKTKRTCVRLPLSKALLDAHISYATVVIANEPFLEFWVDGSMSEIESLLSLRTCIADRLIALVPNRVELCIRVGQRALERQRLSEDE